MARVYRSEPGQRDGQAALHLHGAQARWKGNRKVVDLAILDTTNDPALGQLRRTARIYAALAAAPSLAGVPQL